MGSGRPAISGFLREHEDERKILAVMASEHVSIQVARNLLKAGKLGVGPAAKIAQGGPPPEREWEKDISFASKRANAPLDDGPRELPPKRDKKAAERAMAEKL